MGIHKLIPNGSFGGPDEIRVVSEGYEASLVVLHLRNSDDPITKLIAKSIIN